jgi:glycogen debranching enzyme
MSAALDILADLRRATAAAFALAEALAQAQGDAEAWTRLPSAKGGRCPVSGWSRSTILRAIADGTVRTKSVGSARYYSAADVRALIAN